jgi:RNA polymerase sigma factor (sigma-70 family)
VARTGVTEDLATARVASAFDANDTSRVGRDPAALERFYLAFYDDVVTYFARRVGDAHDVADLVADTFLAAIAAAHTYDSRRGRPLPWLIGIAHNVWRRMLRQRNSHRLAVGRVAGRKLLDPDDIDQLEERIDAERQGAQALGLLQRLSEAEREIVELVDLAGLTPTEAAQATGIPAGLARIRLHRAHRRLHTALNTVKEQ